MALYHLGVALRKLGTALTHLEMALSHLRLALSHPGGVLFHIRLAMSHLGRALSQLMGCTPPGLSCLFLDFVVTGFLFLAWKTLFFTSTRNRCFSPLDCEIMVHLWHGIACLRGRRGCCRIGIQVLSYHMDEKHPWLEAPLTFFEDVLDRCWAGCFRTRWSRKLWSSGWRRTCRTTTLKQP